MSDHDPLGPEPGAPEESVLSRWSRLKAGARRREAPGAEPKAPEVQAVPEAPEPPASEAAPTAAEAPPLPDLGTLGQDSDYSAFLSPGVDAELRRRALRQLFRSPKFNVFDGLDTYRDDFRSFPALGDVVTADMRYQMERAARELAERAKAALTEDAPAPAAALAAEPDAAQTAAAQAPQGIQEPDGARPESPAPEDMTRGRNEDDAANGTA